MLQKDWSRICAFMGTGFQFLNEGLTYRIGKVSEWMSNNEKEQMGQIAKRDSEIEELKTVVEA